MRPPKHAGVAKPGGSGSTIFNISHSNVGAVQAGANSSASHISLNATDECRLVDALEALRIELSSGGVLRPRRLSKASTQSGDIVAAVKAPKPNGRKIRGLLSGLAESVETAEALPGAWDTVKDIASAIFRRILSVHTSVLTLAGEKNEKISSLRRGFFARGGACSSVRASPADRQKHVPRVGA